MKKTLFLKKCINYFLVDQKRPTVNLLYVSSVVGCFLISSLLFAAQFLWSTGQGTSYHGQITDSSIISSHDSLSGSITTADSIGSNASLIEATLLESGVINLDPVRDGIFVFLGLALLLDTCQLIRVTLSINDSSQALATMNEQAWILPSTFNEWAITWIYGNTPEIICDLVPTIAEAAVPIAANPDTLRVVCIKTFEYGILTHFSSVLASSVIHYIKILGWCS